MMEILLILYTSHYHIYKTVLIAKNKLIEVNLTEYTRAKRPNRMSEYRERKPTSKGLLPRVKIMSTKKRAHERDSFSLSQASWIGFFAKIHYFSVLSRFSKPFWKLPKESYLRHFPPLEVPSNGIEVNTERSWLHTNWHFTRTVYHRSLILRSFRAKPKLIEDDANGFVKALCHFPHLWILNRLFKNQTLAHTQKRDCVPLNEASNGFSAVRFLRRSGSYSKWV